MATGREVVILGVGMHPWGVFPDKNLQDLLHGREIALLDPGDN